MTTEEIRIFTDGILTAIGQPNLTDSESVALPAVIGDEPTDEELVEIYKALADIINAREFPDDGIQKLNAYAVLHDVDFSGKRKVHNNIFIGASLEN